ncbi:beta-ketoacyl-ACP synthase II [Endozoicomonas arenosclerae]|uniref:beta-ketoacyl-ACP synthase II n=1 Tax=Endozoicomonas arenosclerae TaxID=1633495 RepID=UPI00078204D5|nr:beta-ketoacyl-ACP synthase II [Endozoicomonas arenosclerae]
MSHRRVVVTGLGALSPVGLGVDQSWQSVLAGRSGIHTIDHLDTEKFSVSICGTVKGFEVAEYFNPKDARKMDVFIQYALAASIEAMKDAGLDGSELLKGDNTGRYGVVIGSGIGGITSIEQSYDTLQKSGPRRISPFFIPAAIINMAAGWLSMHYNLQGPNFATSTACATGSHALALAARTIAYGDADIMVAGGAEKASSALGMTGFAAARALSTRNDQPEAASRPWDKDRDGFVLGDGAGVMVLEEYEHAVRRGATIYAELSGVGMSGDAYHMTSPPEDGRGAARAMQSALDDAGLKAEQVAYINAHGTSTPAGDIAETRAIHTVFGQAAKKVAVSSTKSMTGHLLGAAGSLEGVFAVKSLQDGMAPPTINLENPDEGCDLDYVPGKARPIEMEHVLTNSFGFGGTNVTLAFSKLD